MDSITVEQIREAVEKQPDLKTGILSSFKDDFIKTPPADVVVRTKEQDDQFVQSSVEKILPQKVEEKFNLKFKEKLDEMDATIEQLTGEKKEVKEFTTDFAKRAFKAYHSKGGDPVTKERVKQLEDSLNTMKTDYEKKLSDSEGKLFSKEIDWQMNGELDKVNIALPVHLKTDQEKQGFITQQKALIKQGFLSAYQPKKDDQGNIVFYKGDQPQLSQKDGKPMSAGELIAKDYAPWFVPAGIQQGGTGIGAGNGQGAGLPSGGFKDKESIHAYLAANGIEAGSKKYMDELQRIASESKIAI
jgi:hypothetical protein